MMCLLLIPLLLLLQLLLLLLFLEQRKLQPPSLGLCSLTCYQRIRQHCVRGSTLSPHSLLDDMLLLLLLLLL